MQVIGNEETLLWSSAPAKDVVARIFYNNARLVRLLFFIFFAICDGIVIGLGLFALLKAFELGLLVSIITFSILFSFASAYLMYSFFQIKESIYLSQSWYSEYALTNKKLYLKLTRLAATNKDHPITCKIRIIGIPLIQRIKMYKSFWDKRYKKTGSFRIKFKSPYPSITLYNLPDPETAMAALSSALNSIQNQTSS
jgi:hypothetical protein